MRLPKEFVERKLSAALGAHVAVATLKVSLLAGSLDVRGVTVRAGHALDPILTIRRIKADVALGAMLRKELVVRSVVIEGPVLSVVRAADGSLNLPRRDATPRRGATSSEPADGGNDDNDTPSTWKLAAEKVQVLDGAARYRDASGYQVSADRIVAELVQKPDGVHVTVLAASVGRRDDPLDLGEARAHALVRATEIARVPDGPLAGTFEVGDLLRGTVQSPAITAQRAELDVHAKLVLPMLRKLAPPDLVPKLRLDGQVEAHVVATVDAAEGLRVASVTLSGSDIVVRPSGGVLA